MNVTVTVLSLAYIVFSLVKLNVNSEGRKVARIEVVIADSGKVGFIDEDEVRMIIESSVMNCGEVLDSVELYKVEDALHQVPCIKKAVVSSDMDGVVHVEVMQRRATFRLMCDSGDDFYVADTFVFIKPVDGYRPEVPVVSVNLNLDFQCDSSNIETIKKNNEQVEFIKKIHTFVEIMSGDEFLRNFIEQIYVARHTQSGEIEINIMPSVGSGRIRFGELESIEEKLIKIKNFYSEAYNYANLDTAHLVDARFEHQIIVK